MGFIQYENDRELLLLLPTCANVDGLLSSASPPLSTQLWRVPLCCPWRWGWGRREADVGLQGPSVPMEKTSANKVPYYQEHRVRNAFESK